MLQKLSNLFSSSKTSYPNQVAPAASCPPESLRPPFRFALLRPVQLYGFLPWVRSSPNPGFLYLQDPGPAQLSYILGPDWQSRLITIKENPQELPKNVRLGPDYQSRLEYIPISSDDDEEAEHCLRMNRCGAVLVKSQTEVRQRIHDFRSDPYPPYSLQETEKDIFGWPAQGVWELRIPKEVWRCTGVDGCGRCSIDNFGAMLEWEEKYGSERDRIKEVQRQVREQKDMDGVCAVLRDAGATFYTDIEHCPEAVEVGLLTVNKTRNDLAPPEAPGSGGWWWKEDT